MEAEDWSGEVLFKPLKELLQRKDIPLTYIMGFASDYCFTMMNVHNKFQSHLKKDIPSLYAIILHYVLVMHEPKCPPILNPF